jgi:DNA-binding GntR family transcriptional regulator
MSNRLSQPSRSPSLRDQVYGALREGLRTGRLQVQDVLVERSLAEEMGVSRTPVREALAQLERDGIVTASARGFSLAAPSDADIRDIYEIRQLLEPAALAGVAAQLSDVALKRLEKALAAQARAHGHGDADGFAQANYRFRAAWLAEVRNPRLVSAIERYNDHVVYLRAATLADPGARAAALESLDKVMAGLRVRDATVTRRAMTAHLRRAEHALRQALQGLDRKRPSLAPEQEMPGS